MQRPYNRYRGTDLPHVIVTEQMKTRRSFVFVQYTQKSLRQRKFAVKAILSFNKDDH